MKVVAVQSISPGAGATSLVANLVSALQRCGKNVVAIDADPRDQLKLHFGMTLADQEGWWNSSNDTIELTGSAFSARAEIDSERVVANFIPFGLHSRTIDSDPAHDVLLRNPKAFQHALAQLPVKEPTVVLINTSDSLAMLHYQIMNAADEVIVLLEPGPLWQAQLLRGYRDFIGERLQSDRSLSVLLTKCRPELRLANDCVQLIEAELAAKILAPFQINHDQHVPEALAQHRLVEEVNASSSYANDIDALAMWLVSRLEQL